MGAKTRQVSRKICVGCKADISHQPRTKDQQGNYYCAPCWRKKMHDAAPPNHFVGAKIDCSPSSEVTPAPIDDINPKSSFWKTDLGLVAAGCTVFALGFAMIVGWSSWS